MSYPEPRVKDSLTPFGLHLALSALTLHETPPEYFCQTERTFGGPITRRTLVAQTNLRHVELEAYQPLGFSDEETNLHWWRLDLGDLQREIETPLRVVLHKRLAQVWHRD